MPKVFESTGNTSKSPSNFHLYIQGDGMFVMRSPWKLTDERAGVRNDVYYTRNGKFTRQSDGTLTDEHGGILQCAHVFTTSDLKIIPNKRYKERNFFFASHGNLYCTVNDTTYILEKQLELAAGLEAPIPAQLKSGRILSDCWTGKVVNNQIKPFIIGYKYEILLDVNEYNLAPIIKSKSSWSLNLWSICCSEEEKSSNNEFSPIQISPSTNCNDNAVKSSSVSPSLRNT